MYEGKTIDAIQDELLSNVSDSYEKSPGYPTCDILKSFAIEENKLYIILQQMMDMLDVDKLTRDSLEKYVLQRKGIIRKPATKACGVISVNGVGGIHSGDLFSTSNSVQFVATEDVMVNNTAEVKIEAVEAGSSGNVGSNCITQMPVTLAGIVSANNATYTIGGYEAESDESLRDRYYDALRLPANSGNIFHYIKWGKEVTGVGDVKVVPLWQGANTVKIIIINSDKQVANIDLINKVQNYIDPKGINNINVWGCGYGQAPIGAYCSVVSAVAKTININVDVQEDENYTLKEVIENVKTNITNYLKEIAFKQDYVSYAKIGSIILNTTGVKDYTILTIDGATSNIAIANEEIAVLGNVVVT